MGMAIGSVVLHTALGLQRPIDRTYLSFACIMVLVAVFLYFQWMLYRSPTSEIAVHVKQKQVTIVNLCYACMFIFVPAYSRVQLPRWLQGAFWIGLVIALVANVALPYGLWFSGEPQLIASSFRGEPYTIIVVPAMAAPQLAYAAFVMSYMILALVCAAKMYRRGERERAVTFAIALSLVVAYALLDIIRDNVGGTWPYMVEYGIVSWALLISVQLAHDFRHNTQTLGAAIEHLDAQSRQLDGMIDSLSALEHDMKRPLETLDCGVVGLTRRTPAEDPQLRRVERAVTRLKQLAHSMPAMRAQRH
jgi:hypothetical protein